MSFEHAAPRLSGPTIKVGTVSTAERNRSATHCFNFKDCFKGTDEHENRATKTGMETRSGSGRHEEGEDKIRKTLRWRARDEDIPAEEGGHTVGQPFVETDGTYGHY